MINVRQVTVPRKKFALVLGTAILLIIILVTYSLSAGFIAPPSETVLSSSLPLQQIWQYEADQRLIFPPYAQDGIVFIKSAQSIMGFGRLEVTMHALDGKTGVKLWESPIHTVYRDIKPVIFDDRVIITLDTERSLRALAKSTGQILWETASAEASDSIHALARDDKLLFVGSGIDPVRIYAVDPETGKAVWEQSESFPARSLVSIIYEDDKLYALFTTGVYVLSPQTGEVRSQAKINIAPYDTPSHQGNLLFLNAREGIWAVQLDSSMPRWAFLPKCIKDANENEGPTRTGKYFLYAPSPVGDRTFVTGGCHRIFALDTKLGTELWEYAGGSIGTISQLVAIDKQGYVMFSDGSIRCFDLASGKEIGRLVTRLKDTGWTVKGQGLAVTSGWLYATFGNTTLYAFN